MVSWALSGPCGPKLIEKSAQLRHGLWLWDRKQQTLQPTQDSAEPPSAQPAFPPVTTMAPQIPFSSLCELGPRGKAMLLCMQFLPCLCWLNRVEGELMGAEAGGLSLNRDGDGDRLVGEDSVCQLLSCVVAASRDARALPPHSLLLRCPWWQLRQWTTGSPTDSPP